MKTKVFCLMAACLLSISSIYSQSKKKIREHKIISETTYNTKIVDGKEVSIKDSYTAYDKNGNIVEEIEYNKDGVVKKKEKSVYNSNKDKIEEVRTGANGKFISKSTFLYNGSGEKVGEIEYDEAGKIIRQTLTVFDAKGFKIEKRVFDSNKKLLYVKKYVYNKR